MTVLIVSCSTKETSKTRENGDVEKLVEMTIYPETGYRPNMMSNIWTQPLVVSDNDSNKKQRMLSRISEGVEVV